MDSPNLYRNITQKNETKIENIPSAMYTDIYYLFCPKFFGIE